MRLDKYLKVSRLIKRRTVANEACDSGRVKLNDSKNYQCSGNDSKRRCKRDVRIYLNRTAEKTTRTEENME